MALYAKFADIMLHRVGTTRRSHRIRAEPPTGDGSGRAMTARRFPSGTGGFFPSLLRRVLVEPRIERALEGADAVMALRLQRERQQAGLLPSLREYTMRYGLTMERLQRMKPAPFVLHPGPMNEGIEIDADVAHSAWSLVEEQVMNGVATRMAALEMIELAMGATQ